MYSIIRVNGWVVTFRTVGVDEIDIYEVIKNGDSYIELDSRNLKEIYFTIISGNRFAKLLGALLLS